MIRDHDNLTMVEKALLRPRNYHQLREKHRKSLDKSLGVDSWDPTDEEWSEFLQEWFRIHKEPFQ